MGVFLTVVPVDRAREVIRSIAPPPQGELLPLEEAAGRVLARDATADVDIPGFDRSIVDGFAVQARDTQGASDAIPSMLRCTGRIAMGGEAPHPVKSGECLAIPTGAVLPPGADAAVMIEHAERIGDEVLVRKPVAPGENVLVRGEDFTRGSRVLHTGRILSPQDLGVLAATGNDRVLVARKPVIGVISTGNELVPITSGPDAGQVRDANSYLCTGFVQSRGGVPRLYGIVRDERKVLADALATAARECDAVFLSGGSSKDERDIVASVIEEQGDVLVHGIAIQPGKPTIVGRIGDVPVLGLPGHPASAFVVLSVLGGELLAVMTGGKMRTCTATARLTMNVPSPKGREDYVRVRLENGRATPLFGKSGLLNTLMRSDGVIRIGAESEGAEAGDEVEVVLW